MRNFRFAALAAALASVASPALADKYFAVTPSGAAEMVYPDQPSAVIGKLSSKCIDAKWKVVTSSTNEVVCEAPLNMGQSIMGQLLMGNSYSTAPRRFFRFNVAEINGVSRVQATGWMELQMAFGQMKRTDFSGPEFHNNIMTFMGMAGGKFPVGTTFPNHVHMGFDSDDTLVDKYLAMRVTKVVPGFPAEKAGLRVGDVVTRIAGKRFKAMDDYLDATAKAAEGPTFEIEVLRDGKPIKLTLERSFRPTWTQAIVARAEAPVDASATPSNLSVADELTKLAKLKSDGVITQAEFDAQKAKLLSGTP